MIINITSGACLNDFLIKENNGIYIPFNEAMIQGDLIYPLFDEVFIMKRSSIHNVTEQFYINQIKDFINIKENINDIKIINLWFGKDAFCIINMLTVLVYLEDINYDGKVYIQIVDDYSNQVIESDIEVSLGEFKNIYINLINKKQLKSTVNFINDGISDYLYISSDNNEILDYIKENIKKISQQELIIELLDRTVKYGLSDIYILSMIKKIEE